MMSYWKNMAIHRLSDYEKMEQALSQLPMVIASYRCMGSKGEKLDAMAKKTTLRQRLGAVEQWLKLTDKGLRVLTPEERLVLQMLYIAPQKGNIQRLCGLLECEQSTVYRRRDKALEKFTVAMYGRAASRR